MELRLNGSSELHGSLDRSGVKKGMGQTKDIFGSSVEHFIREGEPLAPHTWLRIGGPAKFYSEPTEHESLIELVKGAQASNIPIRVLGGGSNLLVPSEGLDGLVLNLSAPAFSSMAIEGNSIRCGGGTKLSHLVTHSVGAGLSGLEYLVGIPGTVGGALSGNASTLNGDIGQRVSKVRLLTRRGEVIERNRQQLQFSHHKSSLDELVILEATFELEESEVKYLTQRMQTLWIVKRSNQPTIQTSAIIPFVDPDTSSAAELIELAGLRGAVEGNVHLSTHHPNFLVSTPNATSQQVLALIHRVREVVQQRTGVQLRTHVTIW